MFYIFLFLINSISIKLKLELFEENQTVRERREAYKPKSIKQKRTTEAEIQNDN
jgi:hypothetical protein